MAEYPHSGLEERRETQVLEGSCLRFISEDPFPLSLSLPLPPLFRSVGSKIRFILATKSPFDRFNTLQTRAAIDSTEAIASPCLLPPFLIRSDEISRDSFAAQISIVNDAG